MLRLLSRPHLACLFRRFALESSFKSKNILRDFVKYVHPDILVGAPERVKEQNGRSMQLLNAYLDSLKKNEGSKAVDVRFYTPEKSNKKSRKFYYFKTRLDAFASQLREEDLEGQRKKVAEALFSSLHEVVETKTGEPKKKIQTIGKDGVPKGFIDLDTATLDSHPEVFERNSGKKAQYLSELQSINLAYEKYVSTLEHDKLVADISESIMVVDPGNRRRKEYAQELVRNLVFIKNKELLLSNVFDPRYILLDETLPELVVTEFARRVDRSPYKKECADSLVQVFNTIRDHYPNLWVVLSSRYSTEVPGCVHVNWRGDLRIISKYLSENVQLALDKMHDYQHDIKSLEKLRRDVLEEFGLHRLALDFKTRDLQSESVFLVSVRTLLRELLAEQPKLRPGLRQLSIELGDREELSRYEYRLQWNFSVAKVKEHVKQQLV